MFSALPPKPDIVGCGWHVRGCTRRICRVFGQRPQRRSSMIPETATTKMSALALAAADARSLAFAAKDRLEAAQGRVVQLHNAHADEDQIAKAMTAVEAAQALQQERYHRWQDCEALCTRCQSWLRELPRTTVLETVAPPSISMNGTAVTVVAGLRSRITKLVAEHHAIRTADAPLDDAKAQARCWSSISVPRAGPPSTHSSVSFTSEAGQPPSNSVQRFTTRPSQLSRG